ncbi:hypothetical protein ACQFYA_12430 [Promicromonospora sp. Marseille-Q5078]
MPTQTLPIPTDAGARDALLARVRALAALRHPCVEPVAAVDVRDDGTLAVRRGGAAADLPTVLAVRGRLTSREAAGVLVAVARGLAALHSAGLRQGGLGAADVVLGPGGDAMLRPRAAAEVGATDGADRAVGADRADGEAADVHALATLVADLLGDRADDAATALRAVLAPASAPDPRVRPEAGTLAAQADAAVPPEPVRLPERAALAGAALGRRSGAPAPTVTPARRRAVRGPGGGRVRGVARRPRRSARPAPQRSRRVLGVAGAVGLVAVLTAVVVQVRLPGDPAEPPRPTDAATAVGEADGGEATDPTQERADPAAAAAELTRRRVALLSDGSGTGAPDAPDVADVADLAGVDVPGSPAHDADAALLDDIGQAGTRVRGASARLDDVRTQRHEGDEADVVVRYAVGAHEQVAPGGVVTAVPATDPRSATLRLAWTADGWRVAEVS